MTERRVDKRLLAPVLMGFFIMGFCDIVEIGRASCRERV